MLSILHSSFLMKVTMPKPMVVIIEPMAVIIVLPYSRRPKVIYYSVKLYLQDIIHIEENLSTISVCGIQLTITYYLDGDWKFDHYDSMKQWSISDV